MDIQTLFIENQATKTPIIAETITEIKMLYPDTIAPASEHVININNTVVKNTIPPITQGKNLLPYSAMIGPAIIIIKPIVHGYFFKNLVKDKGSFAAIGHPLACSITTFTLQPDLSTERILA